MPRVLLVDDSALTRNSMQGALEPWGIELAHAENGEVAVAKASVGRWDLIFLDVVMPVMDGPTALAKIRAAGVTAPVVLVTSVSSASIVATAVRLGGVQYIAKPFTQDMIRAIAAKILKLDPSKCRTPHLLVHTTRPELPRALAKVLPAHVAVDVATTLGESLVHAETHAPELVLIDTANPDEAAAFATVFRDLLPSAGIFAVDATAAPRAPWCPDGALDGVIAGPIDAALGRGFLYQNFLRPLVLVDGRTARAAGFQGPAAYMPAYQVMVERALRDRCRRLDLSIDVHVDLEDVTGEPEFVVELATRLNDELREVGAAASFRIGAPAARTMPVPKFLMA